MCLHLCHPSHFIANIVAVWLTIEFRTPTNTQVLSLPSHPLSLFCCSQGQATGPDVPFGNSFIQHVAWREIPWTVQNAGDVPNQKPLDTTSSHINIVEEHFLLAHACLARLPVGSAWAEFGSLCWNGRGESRGEEHQRHLGTILISVGCCQHYSTVHLSSSLACLPSCGESAALHLCDCLQVGIQRRRLINAFRMNECNDAWMIDVVKPK